MPKTITIGRSSDNQIVIADRSVSQHHAVITVDPDGTVKIKDLNSTNGTYINNKKVSEAVLSGSDKVMAANVVVEWLSHTQESAPVGNIVKTSTVGRALSNDIVIARGDVSSFHAKLFLTDGGQIFVQDNGSTNGTFVNGQKVIRKQLAPDDKVLLANKYPVDWSHAFDPQKTILRQKQDPLPQAGRPSKKRSLVGVTVTTGCLLIIVLGFIFFKPLRSSVFPVDVNDNYRSAVVLVYHSFVYEVIVGDKHIYATKEGDELVRYDPEENSPMALTGTGFFVSEKGEIITNRHVAMPWEYGTEKDQLREAFRDMIASNIADLEGLQNAVKAMSEIRISGKTVELGVALNDSYLSDTDDLIKCVFVKESGKPEIDVALLQVKDKTLPSKVHHLIDLKQALNDEHKIKDGMEVHMIGYPFGTELGITRVGLKSTYQKGVISQEPSGFYFMLNASAWHGSSGSPIMNNQGQLVGILFAGQEETQGFNRGILAKYAIEIMN